MSDSILIRLAVEDALSEAILRRVLAERPVQYVIGAVYGKGGAGYLKKQTRAFNSAAHVYPFVLLTDLDDHECPPGLVTEWLAGRPRNGMFLFRVAVREVESWLLADLASLRSFLHARGSRDIQTPEDLLDPKEELLRIAASGRVTQKREALVRRDDRSGQLRQGPDYNGTLAQFVAESWSVVTARSLCPSLDGLWSALQRLESDVILSGSGAFRPLRE